MSIRYATVLLSYFYVGTYVTLGRVKRLRLRPPKTMLETKEIEFVRRHPLCHIGRMVVPIWQFPGIKLKTVNTGQRLTFEVLFEKVVFDAKQRLYNNRTDIRVRRADLTDIHAQLGDYTADYLFATDGYLEDYATVWRYGRLTLAKHRPNLTMDVFVALHRFQIHYNVVLCVNNTADRANVTGYVQKCTVRLRTNFTLGGPRCLFDFCHAHVYEFGHALYVFRGLDEAYNRTIQDLASNVITRHVVENRRIHEAKIYAIFNESFNKIDPCGYFNYNPDEWKC